MSKYQFLLEDFQLAVKNLEKVLDLPRNEFIRDSAIKRFEIVFELGWKTLQTFLEEFHNVKCNSPRSCFKEAFQQNVIAYDKFWIEVTSIRNYTTHIYSEKFADKIYKQLPRTLKYYSKLLISLKKQE